MSSREYLSSAPLAAYNPLVQLDLMFRSGVPPRSGPRQEWLSLNGRWVRLWLVRNNRARRYILRLTNHGIARVTLPPYGTLGEARQFVARHQQWLERQFQRHASEQTCVTEWKAGTEILFRGEHLRLERVVAGSVSLIRFGTELLRVSDPDRDLRPELELHLWNLARAELPGRVTELARQHQFSVRKISIRNQRSRWGSCSHAGTISLNWRLVQAPAYVRDYIIVHELAHLRHMNHSARFWSEVERLCPATSAAEAWLKSNSGLLRQTER